MYRARGLSGDEPLMGEGALEYAAKNYPRALELYRRLREVAPADPHGPFCEGLTRQALGSAAAALALYEQAREMQRNAPPRTELNLADLEKQMALCCQELKRPQDAVRHFEECLRLRPDHPEREAILKTIESLRH
jgi:tetratricopeptide (TPR) repeat protein